MEANMNLGLALFVLVIFGSSIAASADALIDIQFAPNPRVGPAVLGKEGDKWNALTTVQPTSGTYKFNGQIFPLLDTEGKATGASLTPSGFEGGPVPYSRSVFFADLFHYFILAADGVPATFHFSGLTPNADYRAVFYCNNDQICRTSVFTVNGHSTAFEANTDETAFTSTLASTDSYDGNCLVLTGKSDASGNLDISAMGKGCELFVSGLQIEPVDPNQPEPDMGKLAAAFFAPRIFTDTDGKTMPYRLLLPLGYDKTKQYPTLLFMHSLDEWGDDNHGQLIYSRRFGWKGFQERHPCIVVAPQSPAGYNWVNIGKDLVRSAEPTNSEKMVSKLMDSLQKELSIDPDRIYFTGISAGGFSMWDTFTRPPHRYAAGIDCSGAGDPTTVTPEVAKTPVWCFHSVEDYVAGDRNMIAAMIKMGGHPHYTEYNEGLGHVCWNKAYSTPEVMDWLFKQRKGQPATP